MSFAPSGIGMRLLEMSEMISTSASVKGEIVFPVQQNLMPDAPYTHILNQGFGGGTNCRGCHSGETPYTSASGPAYSSNFVRPDPTKRIAHPYMQYLTKRCGGAGDYRCKMLRAIFQDEKNTASNFPKTIAK